MALSLSGVLELSCFDQASILAGAESVQYQEVTGVTIVEAPDIADWIKGGEMLLTSLYNFHKDYDKQRDMVNKLSKKGASALIVKISRFVTEVPRVILEEGERCNLPIIQIPLETKYVDIIHQVMSELFNRQLLILEHYKHCHNRFINLALNDGHLSDIATELSGIIKHPTIIFNTEMKILAASDEKYSKMITYPTQISKMHEASTLVLNKQHCTFEDQGQPFEETLIATPIKLLENITGHLAVLDVTRPLSQLDYVAMESAVSNAALALTKDKAIKEIEYRFKNDIIDDIINGRYTSIEDIDQRAKTVGWDLNAEHVVILVQLHHLGKNILDEKNLLKRKEAISRILMIINSTAYHYSKSMIVINKSDRFMLLFPSKGILSDSIKRFCEELHHNIKTQIHNITSTIGIGTESNSIPELRKSYNEAIDATAFGKMVFGNDAVIQYNQLGVYRLLCQYNNVDELKKFIHPALMVLSKYDQDKNNDLIRTLEVYLSHNANAKKTAEELFVHYKTIQYRINRIKEIMSIDFEDKQYKLEIEMSLKILNLLDHKQA